MIGTTIATARVVALGGWVDASAVDGVGGLTIVTVGIRGE